jgi:hypothetical protein
VMDGLARYPRVGRDLLDRERCGIRQNPAPGGVEDDIAC